MLKNAEEQLCFVISPIGRAGTDRRRKADAVLALINRAAVEVSRDRKRKLRPYRGEETMLTGDVLRHIVMSILEDDLIVCVMFEPNDNVALELGIAETLGRPVILLAEKEYQAPFDLKLFRRIPYSASLYETCEDALAYEALVAMLRRFVVASDVAPVCKAPFDLGRTLSPPARTYPLDRFSSLGYDTWSQMMLNSEHEIWLAGTTLDELTKPSKTVFQMPIVNALGDTTVRHEKKTILDLLAAMYLRGRVVNVLTMHEDSPHLLALMGSPTKAGRAEMHEDAREEIRRTHRRLDAVLDRLAAGPASESAKLSGVFRVTKVMDRWLTHRVTMTEKIAYVTPIFYARLGFNSGPCFRVTPKSAFEAQQLGGHEYDSICLYEEVRADLEMHLRENPGKVVTGTFRHAT